MTNLAKQLENLGVACVPKEATSRMMDVGVTAAQNQPPNASGEVGYTQIRAAWDAMIIEALRIKD